MLDSIGVSRGGGGHRVRGYGRMPMRETAADPWLKYGGPYEGETPMPMAGRKHLPKKEVMKLKPGTFVRIMWKDAPDEVVMLIEKPTFEVGEISLRYIHSDGRCDSHATNEQVVEVLSHLSWETVHSADDEEFHCRAKLKYDFGSTHEFSLW